MNKYKHCKQPYITVGTVSGIGIILVITKRVYLLQFSQFYVNELSQRSFSCYEP